MSKSDTCSALWVAQSVVLCQNWDLNQKARKAEQYWLSYGSRPEPDHADRRTEPSRPK